MPTAAGGKATHVPLQISSTDYDPDTLTGLATDYHREEGAAPTAQTAGAERAAEAATCLSRALTPSPGHLVRMVQATFRGTPAYLGFYEQGSSGDHGPETVSVLAADRDDCLTLSFAQARPWPPVRDPLRARLLGIRVGYPVWEDAPS